MIKLLPVLLLIFVLPSGYAQDLSTAKINLIEQMITEKMSKDEIPGLSIAIVVNGALSWSKGYGYADLENQVTAKATTAYRSASMGKSITATAVMQLAEQGKLDPEVPIQRYCPYFPEKRWPVNTRHLLAHQSGIRHYGGPRHEAELISKIHYNDITTPLEVFKDDTLVFGPGSRFQYSTYGYNVLGCVVEGAAGSSFMDYLKQHIFQPAGMKATKADDPYQLIPNRARGYQKNEHGTILNAEYVDMSNKIPAGGFVTTVEDMARFAIAFMNDELVNATTRAAMLTPQRTLDGEQTAYGLGWGLFPGEKWYGELEAFHGGRTPGVTGIHYLLPGRKFAVIIIANLEGVGGRVELAAQIAKDVLELR